MKLRHLILSLCLGAGAVHAAGLPPLEHFFENPAFNGAKLSPDGKFLAARISAKGTHDWLSVVDLETSKVTVVAQLRDADIDQFEWVNNQRLMFDSTDKTSADGEMMYAPGLYVVDRDGSRYRQLANRMGHQSQGDIARKLLPTNTFMMGVPGSQDSEFVYVLRGEYDWVTKKATFGLLRVNTENGQSAMVERPGKADYWLLDQNGQPRLCTLYEDGIVKLEYRDPATNKWRLLESFAGFGAPGTGIAPLAFGPDGTLYVLANPGRDKVAVYAYDLVNNKLAKEPLISLPDYDFSGSLITDQQKVLGIRYTSDAEGTLWLDARMKAVQEAVDAQLPGTVNLVTPPRRPESPWVLVQAFSDVQPMVYLAYNTDRKALRRIGSSRDKINPAQMGHQDLVRYKARDGLEIPAWLTLPSGKDKNLPMVVLVHGGPYVRGNSWGWHAQTQFLTSRGYAVLEPEYRGSTGYGSKHFRAGWKQWGLKMQDDVADGVKWAVAQGIVDPKRVCIAGASYGGYSVLMGLANDPELFKCGINWVGVTDMSLLYKDNWRFESDDSDEWRQYGLPVMVGDQEKDAEQLKNTSPVNLAARIRQPLLLAYGGADYRVPLAHGLRFRDAIKPANKNVEWVEYPMEGHGWYLPETRYDFWGRVEKFLAKNIGEEAAK